ncbi:MAG: metallophosphoesterase family protein [Rubripirellula sp.]
MGSPSFSFIHCADLHLDSPFVGVDAVEPQLAKILRDSTFASFEKIVTVAIDRGVDFVVIAGDVYDSAEHSLRAQIRFRDSLERLSAAGIPVYMIHGNHDPLDSWDAKLTLPKTAFRFGGETVGKQSVRRGEELLADIYGISFPTREVEENLATQFKREGNAEFSIGLLHCNVGGQQNHDNYAPCSLDDLINAGMDYWALGHVHTRHVIKQEGPAVVYPGNIQGRSIRETGERGCYHVEVEAGNKIQLHFVPTEIIQWFSEDQASIDANPVETLEALLETLQEKKESLREDAEKRPCIGRMRIEGRCKLHAQLANSKQDFLDTLRAGEADRSDCVWVESINLATKNLVEIDQRRQVDDFVGDFLQAAHAIKEDAVVDRIRTLLLEQPESKKILDQIGTFSDDELKALIESAEQMGLDDLLSEEG